MIRAKTETPADVIRWMQSEDGMFHMFAGKLNEVMGRILYQTPSTIIRITLVSLAHAADRVRVLAERGEIEIDDLPPPAGSRVN
jgi:hypothetical protein